MIPNHGVESLIMSWWCNNRNPYGWRKCQVNIQGCNEWICWVRTWTPSPPPSPCEWTHTVPVEKIITFVTDIVYCAREKHVTSSFSTAQPNLVPRPVLWSGKGVWWLLSFESAYWLEHACGLCLWIVASLVSRLFLVRGKRKWDRGQDVDQKVWKVLGNETTI